MIALLLFWIIATSAIGVAADCNPLTTNGCAAIPGLASSSYSVDFTQVKSLPNDWILASASNISFGSNGIQFNFNKRKEAPYIWTNFYIAYGTIEVVMQVAGGTGIVTSAVMFSDDADEIDWEFSGSNLGAGTGNGKVQTNVFGKGMTGNYDRGTLADVSPIPQTSFHTYTLNWTPDKIDWILDGNTIRTEKNNGQKSGNYQFPQTPSRLHLGMWDAGDPDTAAGTRQWAGGLTDYSKCPYTAYVKSVKITTPYPCKAWRYPTDFSGSWADVKCTNDNISTASATSTSAMPKSTDATYTVVQGDNGYTIADKLGCTFDQLSASNPGVKWDYLDIGQKLNNPNAGAVSTTQSLSSSSGTSTVSKTPTSSASTIKAASSSSYSCFQDGCYNSMTATQFVTSALSFCSAFKTSTIAAPVFLSGCTGDSIRVKSACGCLIQTYSTSSGTTSSPSTIPLTSTSTFTSTSTSKVTTSTTSASTSTSTSKTTTTKTTTTNHYGWGSWNGGNYGGYAGGGWGGWGGWGGSRSNSGVRGWGGWKRGEKSHKSDKHKSGHKGEHRGKHNGHKFGRIGGGRQHA